MVTDRKIRRVVVVADAEMQRMPTPTKPRFRPSDLLPWADPHIRSLVQQLQDEVREEATHRRAAEPRLEDVTRERWEELEAALAGVDGRRF